MNPTDANRGPRAQRRDHILAKAAERFAAKGLDATTVREIGNAAGVLSGSLYHHFPSKEAIVKEIVGRFLGDLVDRHQRVLDSENSPRARLEGLIMASYESIAADRHAARIYQNDFDALRNLGGFADFVELTERFQTMWMDTILAGVACGELRSDIEPRLFYRLARDAIWFSTRWQRPGVGDRSPHEMAAAATSVLLDGFTRTET